MSVVSNQQTQRETAGWESIGVCCEQPTERNSWVGENWCVL